MAKRKSPTRQSQEWTSQSKDLDKQSKDSGKQPTGHYPDWKTYIKLDDRFSTLDSDGADQLMVYRKPVSDAKFSEWLGKIRDDLIARGENSDFQIVSTCGRCDNSLLLFIGKGIETFIKTEAARSGNTDPAKSGMQGEDDAAFYSSNLKINLPKRLIKPVQRKGKPGNYKPSSGTPVKVAVFDTGLVRGEVDSFLTPIVPNPCILTATRGWNFTVPNNLWDDDNPSQHGSNVTRFILEEVVRQNNQSVEIIPIKIHNKDGKSDLYSILCGFAYAKSMGANIINASFGYYAPVRDANDKSTDFCLTVFRKFIKDQLTDNNILLVAAAGNLPSKAEAQALKKRYPKLDPRGRDLGKVGFYPASFASDPTLPNVISVTSVDPKCKFVSLRQNFSSKVVDVGVQTDNVLCQFKNPRTGASIAGSSFATPIVTGLIASNYRLYANMPTKSNIFDKLKNLTTLPKLEQASSLKSKIKDGIVLKRK